MKVKCLYCNTIIESKSVHHMDTCKCGALSIDGGPIYSRFALGKPSDMTYVVSNINEIGWPIQYIDDD